MLTAGVGLPYFKFLKERGRDVGRADFARLQREALENYLIGLIRAVVSSFVLKKPSSWTDAAYRCGTRLQTVLQVSLKLAPLWCHLRSRAAPSTKQVCYESRP